MKNIWKWILGILAVLLVAAIVGGMFLFHNRVMAGGFGPGYAYQQQNGNVRPNMPGWNNSPRGDGNGFRGPMMMKGGGRGFNRFGGGGFFQLVVFGLLLYGAYWLGRRNARIALDPPAAAATKAVDPAETPKTE